MLATVDGRIAPAAETTISITDPGLLRGDGGFEVLRLYDGAPFAFDDHMDRLTHSCEGLQLAFDRELFTEEIAALLGRARPNDALLRLIITRGGRRIAIVEPLLSCPASLDVMTISYQPNGLLNGLKTLSYAANMLAVRVAQEHGFDEALFKTPEGLILEGPTWSFFWARSGVLKTTPLVSILPSITRARIIEEIAVVESGCTYQDLLTADEAFLASTSREVLPIAKIDRIELPSTPGPLTSAAAEAFGARVERELKAGGGSYEHATGLVDLAS